MSENLPMVLLWALLLFWTGRWSYKSWLLCKLCKLWRACSAYPFPEIDSICSSRLFQNGEIFLQEKAKKVLFHVALHFFCTQLYMFFQILGWKRSKNSYVSYWITSRLEKVLFFRQCLYNEITIIIFEILLLFDLQWESTFMNKGFIDSEKKDAQMQYL